MIFKKEKFFNENIHILVTGGAGFIGGCLIRRLLQETNAKIFNLDKLSYASNLSWLKNTPNSQNHKLINLDLSDFDQTKEAIDLIDPDFVFHLAAESHVDRSIEGPEVFIKSNILGTVNLLESLRLHWDKLNQNRKDFFKIHHISTDEVFGSLPRIGSFNEFTRYDPRSPYSASKASSDHLVRAWFHTFGLPIIITNCSNNFGPWQYPEKLIPLTILNAINDIPIPIYGDGCNIRDWLFVEDHINALLLVAEKGKIGSTYCIGGHGEKSNLNIVLDICSMLDKMIKKKSPHKNLIKFVKDRPGHDKRYSIDSSLLKKEFNWKPLNSFEVNLKNTISWYLKNQAWCKKSKL